MSEAIATTGHNKPPLTPPASEEALDDLRGRFPELEAKQKEFEAGLATFPKRDIRLDEPDVAAALQDLLGQIKKQRTVISAHKSSEKKPWDAVVKVVQNFFVKHDDGLKALQDEWMPRYEAFATTKRDEAKRKAEEEAERQRQAAEKARREAEEAEERRRQAEAEAATARAREEEARRQAEGEEKRRREAEEAAARAREEERRIADERRQREKAEKEANATALKEIRTLMKAAENLHALAEGAEATEDETKRLDAHIRPGGLVSQLAGPVASSSLLSDEQREEIEVVRTRLADLREAATARFDAKERRRRAKEAKEAEERERAAAAEREARRKADEEAAAKARAEREKAEAEAAADKEAQRAAQAAAREARADQRDAAREGRTAARDSATAEAEAHRSSNRADRIDRKLENSTEADLSRTRGDLGTVGGLRRSWKHMIVDEAALRAGFINPDGTMAPSASLAEHLESEALNGAVYRWMRAHQGAWQGRQRVEGELPGVVFTYETDAQIRA